MEEIYRTLEIDDHLKEAIGDVQFDRIKEQIDDFKKRSEKRLLARLGFVVDTIPTELDYIVTELTVERFRRKKNEGMTSYTQEGETINYNISFSDYEDEISGWLQSQGYYGQDSGGVATFI